jgi:hypothetical protein
MAGLDGAQWRRIADDTRRLSAKVIDPAVKRDLLRAAANYLRLAEQADEQEGVLDLQWVGDARAG